MGLLIWHPHQSAGISLPVRYTERRIDVRAHPAKASLML
jgi:hypothetical protein